MTSPSTLAPDPLVMPVVNEPQSSDAALRGLSETEAARRLHEEGPNEIQASGRRNFLAIMLEVVREPMFLLLLGGGAIYLLLGETSDAAMLLGFVFLVIGITFYQERKTEHALEALRDLSSPRALVIRDGQRRRVAGREVARGDLVVLSEGDRVPADALILSCVNLSADESLLTGESVPVRKISGSTGHPIAQPGGDDLPFVYSGTLIVQGAGIAEVYATGAHTAIGAIGTAIQSVEQEHTPLQRETGRLVRILAVGGLILCTFVAVLYGLTRGHWLDGLLSGITLAMAVLPEEIPVILTVFMALGAWRLSQKHVLTRRVPAVETLGSATVLCVDKTGTLTLNQMSVQRLYADGALLDLGVATGQPLPDAFHAMAEFGILASQRDPYDPMEKALLRLGDEDEGLAEHRHASWALVHQYPLSPQLLALTHVWEAPGQAAYVVAAKGAPEAIADLCRLSPTQRKDMLDQATLMAGDGLRVLGVARAQRDTGPLPDDQRDLSFDLVGLVGLMDPVRPLVPQAVRECRTAGIRVVMITGDYPVTAQAIARQIGLTPADICLTGPELNALDDAALQLRVRDVSIFARVVPEQKLRLVKAFKAAGEIVAMTGDGVNDAPALKAAHIGVAMGGRGTDVAREAAALVVLDDDFSSIVQAVRLGRRIFDNLQKALSYAIAVHMPIIGLSLFPVLFKWPLALLPVHIVFMELIIDPACSIVFEQEPEEAHVMQRPPRDARKPVFSRALIGMSLLQGAGAMVAVLIMYGLALHWGQGDGEARAFAFTSLILANLGLILSNRSGARSVFTTLRTPNTALWWVVGGAIAFLSMALSIPRLQSMFQFSQLHVGDILLCLLTAFVSIAWFELIKVMRHASASDPNSHASLI
jgi:Ca2+-transporting ATPase